MLRFARTTQLLGDEKVKKLRDANITVCGLGAVGSYAVEALARAGVGNLRLVDFDTVSPSNINRQLYALDSTIDVPKARIAEKRVLDINPDCRVDVREYFIDEKTVESVIEKPVDVLIDAIDSVSSKVHLIRRARGKDIHVVSSMGAAGRLNANEIYTCDIDETHTCPLARIIRRRLHRHGIFKGVRCVFSPEAPMNKLPPVIEEIEAESTAGSDGRRRDPIGSISYVTAIFGLKAAYEAIDYILGDRQ